MPHRKLPFPRIARTATGLRGFARLGGADRLLAMEAFAALVLASAAIRLVPFRRLASSLSAGGRSATGADDVGPVTDRVRWAVNGWGNRVPWHAKCFQRGLAAHWMLRRRGVPTALHYGVKQDGAEGLKAHVWVTAGGADVVGGQEAAQYTLLATFPPEP